MTLDRLDSNLHVLEIAIAPLGLMFQEFIWSLKSLEPSEDEVGILNWIRHTHNVSKVIDQHASSFLHLYSYI